MHQPYESSSSAAARPRTAAGTPATASSGPAPSLTIVGWGGPDGDDQIGWRLVDGLQLRLAPGNERIVVHCVSQSSQFGALLTRGSRLRLLVACSGSGPPGAAYRWEWPTPHLRCCRLDVSGLLQELHAAREQHRQPEELVIWGVEGSTFAADAGLSPELAPQIPRIVARIAAREFGDTADASDTVASDVDATQSPRTRTAAPHRSAD